VNDVLTTADFQPTTTRRRRLISATALAVVILTTATVGLHAADRPAAVPPRQLDASAARATAVTPRIVVFSIPTPSPTHPSKKGDDSTNNGDNSGDNGDDNSGNRVGSVQPSLVLPQGAGLSVVAPAPTNVVYPPPQAPYPVPYPLQSRVAVPVPAQVGVVQPAEMLVPVQCPVGMTGLFCFEAVTTNGTAAALPSNVGVNNLPVISNNAGCSSSTGNDLSESSGEGHDGSKKSGHSDDDPGDSVSLSADGSSGLNDPVQSCGNTLGSLNSLNSVVGSVGNTVSGTSQDVKNAIPGGLSKILTGAPRQTVLRTTGYSYQDNQGGNNSTISCGIIHRKAGGVGTYVDPITVAVPGHAGQEVETPCGTRIYVRAYRRYFVVEDTGATQFDTPHIDIYVGGEGTTKTASDACEEPVTKPSVTATINPPRGEPVDAGPITRPDGKCEIPSGGNPGGGGQESR
jgi:hypothetical protein